METTEQKVSRLQAAIDAVRQLALRHADRHGGGGPDPTKLTTSSHARQHAMDAAADHTGSISSTQHGSIATGDLHPEYATDAELTTHAGGSDPHAGYQKESEKGVVNGYGGLDSSGYVVTSQLGSGTPLATNFLRGDQRWAAAAFLAYIPFDWHEVVVFAP